jgi:hypothetical protein
MLHDLFNWVLAQLANMKSTETSIAAAQAGTGSLIASSPSMAGAQGGKPVPVCATRLSSIRPSPSSAWATERLEDGRYAGLLRPQIHANDAAKQFVSWLRSVGETGEYSPQRVLALYAEFCELERQTPTPDNVLLGALKDVRGVRKLQAKGTTKDGKRHRPTRWVIEPTIHPDAEEAA